VVLRPCLLTPPKAAHNCTLLRPPPSTPPTLQAFLGNTLRSYIPNISGAWLYQKFAIMESPATVAAAYGIPATSPNLGSMSGGLSPEGFLYGSSMVYVMQTLAALHTSGWGDVAASGPQMALINSTWWDKFLTGVFGVWG